MYNSTNLPFFSLNWNVWRPDSAVRDATATYIRKAMVPSRMYAKHQYITIQGSECENTWCYTFQHKIVQVLSHHRL